MRFMPPKEKGSESTKMNDQPIDIQNDAQFAMEPNLRESESIRCEKWRRHFGYRLIVEKKRVLC